MPSSTLVPQWLQMLIRTSISHADQQLSGRVEARWAAYPRAPLAQTGRLEGPNNVREYDSRPPPIGDMLHAFDLEDVAPGDKSMHRVSALVVRLV